jgi:hypothetical protein
MIDDCLKLVISLLPPEDIPPLRLVCRGWIRCVDAILSDVRADFLLCRRHPEVGADARVLTVRCNDSAYFVVDLERDASRWTPVAAQAACDAVGYARRSNPGITPAHPSMTGRVATRLRYGRVMSRAHCRLVGRLHTLREVEFEGCKTWNIGKGQRARMVDSLRQLNDLRVLRAPYHDLGASDTGKLVSASLTHLDLFHNSLGEEGALVIATLTKLRKLDLGNNNLGPGGVSALSSLTSLESLGVSFNKADDESLARCISGMRNLASLKSAWNETGRMTGQVLQAMNFLRTLELGFSDSFPITSFLPSLCLLTELDMPSGAVSVAGAAHISRLPSLARLSLSNNNLGSKGVTALGDGPASKSLTALDVGWNGIGYSGAVSISRAMIALRSLYIQNNEILDVGLHHITKLSALVYLEASSNHVSDTTCRCVAHEIRKTKPSMVFFYR